MVTPEFIGMIKNVKESYEMRCRELCKEYNLSQASLDILLLLADKELAHTAKEISHIIDLKPNLISLYVEKLVQTGYLIRHIEKNDRRIVNLECTKKVEEIYRKGKNIQMQYFKELYSDFSEEEIVMFFSFLEKVNRNAQNMKHHK